MISIDSVNILISLHPSMHSEVPYPTPTQWVLFSFFFSSRFSLFKPSFPELFFEEGMVPIQNGWQGKEFYGKPWKCEKFGSEWHMTKVAECILVEGGTVPILSLQPQFQITRSIKSSRTCGTVTYFLNPLEKEIISSYPPMGSYYIIYQL